MRRRIVAGNWKMNGRFSANHELLSQLMDYHNEKVTSILFPPSIYLEQVGKMLKDTAIHWGAQNVSQYADGAYTGEISAGMLKDVGCQYVLVGHSERRSLFHETNEIIAQKCQVAKEARLTPIVCVGETLKERELGLAENVLAEQLSFITDWENTIIAYEPVWAIGTGVTATPEQAQAMHVWIRQCVAKKNVSIAEKISILYGGSVKANNAKELFAMPDIDGALVGGAALNASEFIAIREAATH